MFRRLRVRGRRGGPIDLTEVDRPVAGRPAPCPRCDGGGYLDRIDLVHGRQHLYCRACDLRWWQALDDSDAGVDPAPVAQVEERHGWIRPRQRPSSR